MITRAVKAAGNDFCITADGESRRRAEYYGKSYDVKPTEGVYNADIFYEMDTGAVFLYDEDDGVWIEQWFEQ